MNIKLWLVLLPFTAVACLAEVPTAERQGNDDEALSAADLAKQTVDALCVPTCPDPARLCKAVCSGDKVPDIPIGCPLPACYCPSPSPSEAKPVGEVDAEPICPDAADYCNAVCDEVKPAKVPEGCPPPACYCGDLKSGSEKASPSKDKAPVECPDVGNYCDAVCNGCKPPVVPKGCPIPGCACPAIECPDLGKYCQAACNGDELPDIPAGCPIASCNCDKPVLQAKKAQKKAQKKALKKAQKKAQKKALSD